MGRITYSIIFILLVVTYQNNSYARKDDYTILVYELVDVVRNKPSDKVNNSEEAPKVRQKIHIKKGSFMVKEIPANQIRNPYYEIKLYKEKIRRSKDRREKNTWKMAIKTSQITDSTHNDNMSEIIRLLNAEEEAKNTKYVEKNLAGWKVRIQEDLINDALYRNRALKEVEKQLLKIRSRVPFKAVKQLQKVTIFLYKKKPGVHKNVTAYYSPLYKAVVFHDATKLHNLSSEDNAVVLHELAHGFHDIVLGYDNIDVINAYNNAVKSGLYLNVKTQNGGTAPRAYALTNEVEYFAELSEAYFSRKYGSLENDYYPFNIHDLKKYDPVGYKLAQKMWGL